MTQYNNVFIVADGLEAIGELAPGAKALSGKISCCVFGGKEDEEEARRWGIDRIYSYLRPEDRMVEDYACLAAQLVKEEGGDLVLCTTSARGRLMAGKIAAYLGSAVTANIASISDEGVTSKMVFGGSAYREEKLLSGIPVITAGAGVFDEPDAITPSEGAVIPIEAEPPTTIRKIGQREKGETIVNLKKSKRIVDVGRGLADEKDLDMCYELAKVMDADVGCSRPVAESNGWMPISRYIGITGCVVSPDLIFTLGVSGQVQHIVGLMQAKTVVAINKDPNALIFQHADFGLVADIYKVVPKLIERLKA